VEKISAGAFLPLPVAPIAIVGANVKGKANYMTVGFISGVNFTPPILCVSINKNHHTPLGIIENGTFSVNIPSVDYVKETDYCGLVSGKIVDKSNVFKTFYGELKTAPMIEEFPITCECVYTGQKVEFEMDILYFSEVKQVYLNKDIADENKKIDISKINPLTITIDSLYRSVGENVGAAYNIGKKYTVEK